MPDKTEQPSGSAPREHDRASADADRDKPKPPKEVGGRGGLDPTRYGDWEKNGRCIDF